MAIRRKTFDIIISQYAPAPPEQGGILGMKNGVICEYIHDNTSLETDKAVYVPNTEFLNDCIAKWADEGVEFCGIVHSHPTSQNDLSSGDHEYIKKLYQLNPHLGVLHFPVIVGDDNMTWYVSCLTNNQLCIRKTIVEIVD
jgi:proteasome lid subunit RPN8/RPN11